MEIEQNAIFTLLMDLMKVIFDESEIQILEETHARLQACHLDDKNDLFNSPNAIRIQDHFQDDLNEEIFEGEHTFYFESDEL